MTKLDIIKENLQFQQLLYENNSNAILRDEYLIPDTHPDVQKILCIDARPVVTNKEIIGDKVMIEGKVEYNVLYIPRDDNEVVNSVNYTEKFTNSLNLNEDEHKVVCEVECKVEHIDARIMNERKISIDGVINLNWEVYKTVDFDFVKDIEASEGIETLKETEAINRLAVSKETELLGKSMIRVGMDKPQISKVLKCSLNLHKKEVKVGDNKVFLGCYCKVNIIYLGDETKELVALEDDVYLSKEEEVAEVLSDMIPSVVYNIKNSELAIEDDDLGEARIINVEFLLGANIKVFSNDEISVIKDAYSPKFPIDLIRENYEIGVLLGSQSSENIIKDSIYLGEDDKKPDRILSSLGNTIITDKKIYDGKVFAEGLLRVNVIYKNSEDSSGYGEVSGDIPFSVVLDMNGVREGMKAITKTTLESLEANIEANTIAVKANISFSAKVFDEVSKEFITDVIEGEGEVNNKKASIIIYVVGKDDTLWNLAKKYNCTVDELMSMNELDSSEGISEGLKLIIPGRAIF
ncbi:MAG: DUF3794 domain-containing protein [Clostridium sp.]|nr:DUF3794 domain-containing protein [Clostridium sp.]